MQKRIDYKNLLFGIDVKTGLAFKANPVFFMCYFIFFLKMVSFFYPFLSIIIELSQRTDVKSGKGDIRHTLQTRVSKPTHGVGQRNRNVYLLHQNKDRH
jgi:hypothetical protein